VVAVTGRTLAYLPSPTQSVWHLGPLPIHAYALCIVAGIAVALRVAANRWRTLGGREGDLWDVSGWAIVFGIIGGRLYHVISDPELYFKHGEHPLNAFKIWDGGLGIWGAVALGGLGAWIGCHRKGIRLSVFADVVIPGVVAAQGLGRWGNWFNNELYGGPTSLPWGLRVHCLWDISLALILIWVSRRWQLGSGQLFAIYVMGYTAGRGWIEALRHDHANHILGLRLNDWTSIVVFLLGVVMFVWRRRTRHDTPYISERSEEPVSAET
jgi:prolipoprotein diacylglyceryltransferase